MGGRRNTQTIEKADPWSEAQTYLKDIFGRAQGLANQGPSQYYPGQTFAPFTPEQLAGQDYLLSYASMLPGRLGTIYGAEQGMLSGQNLMTGAMAAPLVQSAGTLSGLMQTADNPYLDRMVGRAMGSAERSFLDAMRGVRAETQAAGQMIGDTGYARGLDRASENLARSLEGIASGMYGSAYETDRGRALEAARTAGQMFGTGLETGAQQQARALALAPSLTQLGMTPGQVMQDVGGQRQALIQQGINEAMARWDFAQNAPWETLQRYAGIIQGFPNMGGQMTSQQIAARNPLLTAGGGAMTGYAAAQMMGMSNPWLGALAGAAMGLFS